MSKSRWESRTVARQHADPSERLPVLYTATWDPRNFAVKPGSHLTPGLRHGLGTLESARVCDETEKPEKTGPGEAHCRAAAQLRVKPGSRPLVQGNYGEFVGQGCAPDERVFETDPLAAARQVSQKVAGQQRLLQSETETPHLTAGCSPHATP